MPESQFEIVFRQLSTDSETSAVSQAVSATVDVLSESREIAELRRIVTEVSEPRPVFYTGT